MSGLFGAACGGAVSGKEENPTSALLPQPTEKKRRCEG